MTDDAGSRPDAAQGSSRAKESDPQMTTAERRVVVTEEAGLHARPAASFAQAAARAEARVTVARADAPPDSAPAPAPAHSVLSVLALHVRCGDAIVLRATGPGAGAALDALTAIAAPAPPPEA